MAAFGALPPLIARSANVQDSVESLPFDDNSFDMALAINSMQY
jgi:ubiquinone/menaquinone biosynthesis C-methylase UbiE